MAIRARDIAVDLKGVWALAFTSANGVRVFAALSGARGLPVFAVGEGTADAARGSGFADVTAAKGDVKSLAALISESKPISAVLHLAGSARAGDLVRLLAAKGVAARREVIYDAVEIEDLSAAAAATLADRDEYPAVVLFSPRSARLFLRQAARAGLNERLGAAAALCLSREIAAALQGVRWSSVRIAPARHAAAMLLLVEEALAERKGRTGAPR